MVYVGIAGKERGETVSDDDALAYALSECGATITDACAPVLDEFREMMVEWFFSGNWIKEDAT